MLAMSFSRVRLRSLLGERLLRRDGVGGVRALISDEIEHPLSESEGEPEIGSEGS